MLNNETNVDQLGITLHNLGTCSAATIDSLLSLTNVEELDNVYGQGV